MEKAADNFGYVVGGVGIVGTAASAVAFHQEHLPCAQMKVLDGLLDETKSIYHKADADGLLPVDDRREIWEVLEKSDESTAALRIRAYSSTSTFDEYRAWLQGLSREIKQTSADVKKVRAHLVTTSEHNKRRKGAEERARMAVESSSYAAEREAGSLPTAEPVPGPSRIADINGLSVAPLDNLPTTPVSSATDYRRSSEDLSAVHAGSSARSTNSTLVDRPRSWLPSVWSFFQWWRGVSVKSDVELGTRGEAYPIP